MIDSLDPFAPVLGQPQALVQLRAAASRPVHAYMFVGPAGSGKRRAALAFAAALLGDERAQRAAHPDVTVVEREGASINVAQAREISRLAARSPIEGDRKVLVLVDFHLVDEAAPALLKTIEEATDSTTFVILAEAVTKELVTVASRCVRIDFSALSDADIEAALVSEGVSPERAAAAAEASFGNLDRARLLAGDDDVVARRGLWLGAIDRLDGTGSSAALLAADVVASIDHASSALLARHADEAAAAEESVKQGGQGTQVMKALETRHKRELRRLRTDEVRAGLATLAQELSRRLAMAIDRYDTERAEAGLVAVDWASESVKFNPNEALLLQGLFVRLNRRPAPASSRR